MIGISILIILGISVILILLFLLFRELGKLVIGSVLKDRKEAENLDKESKEILAKEAQLLADLKIDK